MSSFSFFTPDGPRIPATQKLEALRVINHRGNTSVVDRVYCGLLSVLGKISAGEIEGSIDVKNVVSKQLDEEFGTDGISANQNFSNGPAVGMTFDNDNNILYTATNGIIYNGFPVTSVVVQRMSKEGVPDKTYSGVIPPPSQTDLITTLGVEVQKTGLAVVNVLNVTAGATNTYIARQKTSGLLDHTFGFNGYATVPVPGLFMSTFVSGTPGKHMIVQNNDKIIVDVAWTVPTVPPAPPAPVYAGLVRVSKDGVFDSNFGVGGFVTVGSIGGNIGGCYQASDNHIYAFGTGLGVSYIKKFNPNGVPANINSWVNEPVIGGSHQAVYELEDKSLVVAGIYTATNKVYLAKYTTNGVLDTTFGQNGVDEYNIFAPQGIYSIDAVDSNTKLMMVIPSVGIAKIGFTTASPASQQFSDNETFRMELPANRINPDYTLIDGEIDCSFGVVSNCGISIFAGMPGLDKDDGFYVAGGTGSVNPSVAKFRKSDELTVGGVVAKSTILAQCLKTLGVSETESSLVKGAPDLMKNPNPRNVNVYTSSSVPLYPLGTKLAQNGCVYRYAYSTSDFTGTGVIVGRSTTLPFSSTITAATGSNIREGSFTFINNSVTALLQNPGSQYQVDTGTFSNIPTTTNGSGSGMVVEVEVLNVAGTPNPPGGVITSVKITSFGTGYVDGDIVYVDGSGDLMQTLPQGVPAQFKLLTADLVENDPRFVHGSMVVKDPNTSLDPLNPNSSPATYHITGTSAGVFGAPVTMTFEMGVDAVISEGDLVGKGVAVTNSKYVIDKVINRITGTNTRTNVVSAPVGANLSKLAGYQWVQTKGPVGSYLEGLTYQIPALPAGLSIAVLDLSAAPTYVPPVFGMAGPMAVFDDPYLGKLAVGTEDQANQVITIDLDLE